MKRICKICGYIVVNNIEICPVCKKNDWEDFDLNQIKKISSDEEFIQSMIKLKQDDIIEYQSRMSQFRLQLQQQELIKKEKEEKNIPKCPHCKSTKIKPISNLNRGVSITMLGIFSKKINKSFECKNCGYTW